MTFQQTAEYLIEFIKIIKASPEGITGGDILATFFQAHPEIPEKDKPNIKLAVGYERSNCRVVGWLHLDDNRSWRWFLTERGEKALEKYPDPADFCRAAKHLRKELGNPTTNGSPNLSDSEREVVKQAVVSQEASITFEDAQETAQESIRNYLLNMSEYTFQDVVADLLTAMGYHVDWVSPPGPDGGCDIVAFSDALGVTKPIIKVQAKRWKNKIGAPDLKSFSANIMDGESGICICLGGFTGEAEKYARDICNRNLTLISQDRFVQLWIENYDKLTDKAKERFRLEPIYYVRPSV